MTSNWTIPVQLMLQSATRWLTAAGFWALIAGPVILLWPGQTVRVLTVLFGVYLVLGGVVMILTALADRDDAPVWGIRVGVGIVVASVGGLVWAWPETTVRSLAVLVGLALVVSGIGDIMVGLRWRPALSAWAWMLGGGVLSVAAGVIALLWPGITVLVLAVVAGGYLMAFGVVALIGAMRIRSAADRLQLNQITPTVVPVEIDLRDTPPLGSPRQPTDRSV